ncbi:(deoxy)nucleoside triphosphate pyrophosphohydrolase [Pedobacter agri]|uniref:8-oxo-dGTP diphosphatase n=1 Tax=Pedobacter agri TaxID=454586 RepID=A0A9X3DAR5_9SPHI|nr:(deoxy)nucleoside triphosphate pyrophosphohydrolase [Pedobacter agri]MCX3264218.1 (deoxy)nucleoside triphosphate pyrophosphohydrolase [Pedobacter agri]
MDTVRVVCGIIFKEDKILLCRRKAEKSLGGYWEFPGGKVEPDESEGDALKRELREELSMQVEINNHFKTITHQYENVQIELIAYGCKFIQADFVLIDHNEIQWVKNTDLLSFNLAPADVPIAKTLIAKRKY